MSKRGCEGAGGPGAVPGQGAALAALGSPLHTGAAPGLTPTLCSVNQFPPG